MRLTGVRPGDIIEIDDGVPFLARVIRVEVGKLLVEGVCNHSVRTVRSRIITKHWRLAGRAKA